MLHSTPPPTALPELLLVDPELHASGAAAHLSNRFTTRIASSFEQALRHVETVQPTVLVTELALPDGDGVELCRAAKATPRPPSVLITTMNPERVPGALTAGCDGVLLKPFAPNLLHARIGRLLRERSAQLLLRARQQRHKSLHVIERARQLEHGTNRHWPETHCPYCAAAGATSFDFASYRRMWYACLSCSKVWIAGRQE